MKIYLSFGRLSYYFLLLIVLFAVFISVLLTIIRVIIGIFVFTFLVLIHLILHHHSHLLVSVVCVQARLSCNWAPLGCLIHFQDCVVIRMMIVLCSYIGVLPNLPPIHGYKTCRGLTSMFFDRMWGHRIHDELEFVWPQLIQSISFFKELRAQNFSGRILLLRFI